MARKDDLFEFDAPKYVDFTKDNLDEADDSYFETPHKIRKGRKQVRESPRVTKKTEKVVEATEQPATVTEEMKQAQAVTEESQEPPTSSESLQEPPTAAATQEPEQPLMEMEHAEETEQPPMQHPEEQEQPHAKYPEEPEQTATEHAGELEQPPTEHTGEPEHPATATPGQVQSTSRGKRRGSHRLSSVGVRQSPRLSAISKALRRSSAARRSTGDAQATTRTQENQVKKMQPQKRVVRRVSGVSAITQEDKKELETLATFRQKITNNKKRKDAPGPSQPLRPTKPQEFHFATDQRLRKHQVEDPAPAPAPHTTHHTRTGPTKPQEFSFATDARLKVKEHVKGEEPETPMEFVRSLRSSTTTLNKNSAVGKGPTIPQPFHLSESRRPQEEDPKKFVSTAELTCKFFVKTPQRFRSTSKRASSTEESEDSKKPRGSTVAHTPNLATSRRRRSLSLMTHEEREQQAFEEAQKHAFKAKPVNKKVLQTPPTGYCVEKKLPTVPEPFNITDSKKLQTPLLPESLSEEMDDAANQSMASLPYGGLPLQGKRTTTKVQPFSFDSRDKAKLMKKQEKIKKVLEEEKSLAEFHAQPMPVFEDGVHGVPAKKPPTPTQVKPFNLHADQRGSVKQERFKHQLEEEAQAEAARRKFHAQGDQVVHKMPFIPEKSNKPLTEISNITLNTEVRASERSEYDHQRKTLEEEMLAAKKMEEERRAAEELAEVTRLRQEAVHKAQPVHKFKPMVIQPAPQMPTVPKSPNFATGSRLRSRSQANSTFSL